MFLFVSKREVCEVKSVAGWLGIEAAGNDAKVPVWARFLSLGAVGVLSQIIPCLGRVGCPPWHRGLAVPWPLCSRGE